MELLLDKEPVYLTETVYDGQTEQGIELDYVLPDYYPDIFKILKCSLTPSIVSYSVSGTQLYIDGVVYIKILYLAENSTDINCIDQRYTYSKTVELVKSADSPSVSIFPRADYCNCRAVSGRRLDVRGAVSCKIKVTGCFESQLLCGVSGCGTESKNNPINYCGSRLYANRQYVVREDIETGAGGGIAAIISVGCTAAVSDTKIIADKVVVKGEAKVKALYLTRNSSGVIETEVMEAAVPLSQIIDIEGITDSHSCYARLEVMDCDLEIKQSDDGENRVLGCDITVDCKVSAYKEAVISPVCDIYSTEYETDFTTTLVKIEQTPQLISAQNSFKTEVECSDGNISEIFDCKCDLTGTSVRTAEDGRLIIGGQAAIQLVGRNSDGKPVVIEKTESFEIEPDVTVDRDAYSISPAVSITGVSYSITGDKTAEVRAQISAGGLLYRLKTVGAVSEIVVNEDKPKQKSKEYALKLYYAESGESVWDIAKKYNTAASSVAAENELEQEIISAPCMLLIPIV